LRILGTAFLVDHFTEIRGIEGDGTTDIPQATEQNFLLLTCQLNIEICHFRNLPVHNHSRPKTAIHPWLPAFAVTDPFLPSRPSTVWTNGFITARGGK